MTAKKIIILMIFCLMGVFLLKDIESKAGRPTNGVAAKWGRLYVKGTGLVNKKGKEVQLKGVSTHGIAWYPQYVNKEQFASWKKFGANTVRLALYSAKQDGFHTSFYKNIDEGVKIATKLGMYVIIDWHILSDGDPNMNKNSAIKFFAVMAKKYKKYTNVLYEICNEPNGVSWTKSIKPYAKKICNVIRKQDKKAIIIIGTPTWSQDVDEVAKNPLKDEKNLMYALHFYAATHGEWLREKAKRALDAKLPIFISEFSICDASGNGGINYNEADKWMDFIKKFKLGFIGWNISNKAEASALIKNSCKKTRKIQKKDLSKTGKWLVKQFSKIK